jgi:hypothetical protein
MKIFVSELKVELTGKFERHFSRQSNTLANQQIGANVKGKMSKLQKLFKRRNNFEKLNIYAK